MEAEKEQQLMRELQKYDTSLISICLEKEKKWVQLYTPREDKWYTDSSIKCQTPEFGPRVGHVVTMRVGMPVPGYTPPTRLELLKLINDSPKPVTLVIQVDEPKGLRNTDSNFGGLFGRRCKVLGVENVICDGPVRDTAELKDQGMQVMIPGTIAGCAPSVIYELNGKVTVAGMEVGPGEIVHMDQDGACKFPREKLAEVVECASRLKAEEEELCERIAQCKTLEDCLATY